jgi:hypothetical protein
MRPRNPELAALRLYIAVSAAAETGAGFSGFKVGDELHPPIGRCLAALTALSRQIAFAVPRYTRRAGVYYITKNYKASPLWTSVES